MRYSVYLLLWQQCHSELWLCHKATEIQQPQHFLCLMTSHQFCCSLSSQVQNSFANKLLHRVLRVVCSGAKDCINFWKTRANHQKMWRRVICLCDSMNLITVYCAVQNQTLCQPRVTHVNFWIITLYCNMSNKEKI